jgi:PAS domain S-box-containing protein
MSEKNSLPPSAGESQNSAFQAPGKGHIIDTLNSGKDTSKHNNPKEKLASEREWLEIVTRNIGAGLAIISKDFRTLWANDVLQDLFGDCVGKVCYIHYNHREEICPGCGVREILYNGAEKSIHEQVGRDSAGNAVWSQIIATSIRDKEGNTIAVLELVIPITERKQIEDQLRDSENRYRAIFENTGTATLIIEEDTTISLINEEFEKQTGYLKEEVEGKKSWTDFIVEDDLERLLNQHRLRRENPNAALKNYEFRGRDKSGQIKYLLLTIGMIPGTKKSVASLLDITERRLMEKALLSFLSPKGGTYAKRDKLDIIENILLICRNNAKKTEIVYKTNLNFKKAEVYLKWLIDRELLTKEGKFFKITLKGSELLSNLHYAATFPDLK